jgi:hypothetical protein
MSHIGARIGNRLDGQPIWLHSGADGAILAGPDDPDAPDPDDDSDPDDGDDPDDDDDPEPPSRKVAGDEWYGLRAQLKRARSDVKRRGGKLDGDLEWDEADTESPTPQDAQRLRHLIRLTRDRAAELRVDRRDNPSAPQRPPAAQKPTDADSADADKLTPAQLEAALERASQRAAQDTEGRFKPVLVREATKAALAAAGWNGGGNGLASDPEKLQGALDRVMRLVDQDQVEIDAQGNITGVAEQVGALKEEFPEWFRSRPARRPAAADVDGEPRRRAPAPQPKSWMQKVDERFVGGRRR